MVFKLLFILPLAILSLYLVYRWWPQEWEDSNETVNDWELDSLIRVVKITVLGLIWLFYYEKFF